MNDKWLMKFQVFVFSCRYYIHMYVRIRMNYIYLINLVSDDHSQNIHSVNDLKQEIKSIRKVYSNKIEFLFWAQFKIISA